MTDCTPEQARYIADRADGKQIPAGLMGTFVAAISSSTALRSLANQVEALTAERDVLKNAPNAWADLWYFVMDEEPMAFEKIVTECSPKIWHSEAHKLMRAKHPK